MSKHQPKARRGASGPAAAWEDLFEAIVRVEDMCERLQPDDTYGRGILEGALSNLLAARLIASELHELERTLDAKIEWLAEALTRAIQRP